MQAFMRELVSILRLLHFDTAIVGLLVGVKLHEGNIIILITASILLYHHIHNVYLQIKSFFFYLSIFVYPELAFYKIIKNC